MSVIPYQTIKWYCHQQPREEWAPPVTEKPLITPYSERTVHNGMTYGCGAASYDVRIAQDVVLCPPRTEQREIWAIAESLDVNPKTIKPFVLASTIEHFALPPFLCGTVRDKSSWARRGIALQNTFLDPGWEGCLTIEISNHGNEIIHIMAGSPIAQIVFETLTEPTWKPYAGKYQGQGTDPQPVIMEE